MQSVAVCALDNDIVRLMHIVLFAQNGHIDISEVAAENHLASCVPLGEPCLYRRRAEQMPCVHKPYLNSLAHMEPLSKLAGAQAVYCLLGVRDIVYRRSFTVSRTARLTVFPFGLLLLNMGAVAQHYRGKITCLLRCVYRALEAVFAQQRQKSAVVDVRVRQQYKINKHRTYRKLLIFKQVLPLLHAAVHKGVLPVHLYQCAASRYFVCRAKKCQLHKLTSRIPFVRTVSAVFCRVSEHFSVLSLILYSIMLVLYICMIYFYFIFGCFHI